MNSDLDIEILEREKSQSCADWKSLLLQIMYWTWEAKFVPGKLPENQCGKIMDKFYFLSKRDHIVPDGLNK